MKKTLTFQVDFELDDEMGLTYVTSQEGRIGPLSPDRIMVMHREDLIWEQLDARMETASDMWWK